MTSISEVALVLRNGKSVKQSADAGGLPITRIETIADWEINPDRVGFADLTETDNQDWLLQSGDILISHINSTKHLGKCAIYKGIPSQLVHGMNLLALRVDKDKADPVYTYKMLASPAFRRQLPRITKHSVNQSSFNIANFKKLQIPLPPLPEQKRIAAILDAADALRAKRRESLEQLDQLLQSTFLEMFGDPVTNPKGWDETKLEKLGAVQGGLQVTTKRKSLPIEHPYLRVANVFRGFLQLEEIKNIRMTESEFARVVLEKDDILIVEGHGNKEEIGRCAKWDGSIENCVHQNHLIRFRCNQIRVVPIFIEAYLNSDGGRKGLLGSARTTSGLNTISVSKVKSATVYIPPLDLQQRFATIVESIEQQKARYRAQLDELDTLFASLQSRAFNGEL